MDRAPSSPYQRYGKTPYKYSSQYQAWRSAVTEGGASSQRALDAACHHAKFVGVRHNCADGSVANDCEGKRYG